MSLSALKNFQPFRESPFGELKNIELQSKGLKMLIGTSPAEDHLLSLWSVGDDSFRADTTQVIASEGYFWSPAIFWVARTRIFTKKKNHSNIGVSSTLLSENNALQCIRYAFLNLLHHPKFTMLFIKNI